MPAPACVRERKKTARVVVGLCWLYLRRNGYDSGTLLGDGLLGFGLCPGGLLLVKFADLEGGEGLEESCAVVGPGGIGELEHLLGELSVELGGSVGEVGLNVDELMSGRGGEGRLWVGGQG